jgi:hypothetical protein
LGGLEEGPKTVVLIEELIEVAVLGVGGREFSLMMEQRRELAVVTEAGRGAASAVLGVFDSNGTEVGVDWLLGVVMERLGAWGRMETTRALLCVVGTVEARLARLLLAMWMVSEGSRLRLGEVRLRWRPEAFFFSPRNSGPLTGEPLSLLLNRLLFLRSINETFGSRSFSNMTL